MCVCVCVCVCDSVGVWPWGVCVGVGGGGVCTDPTGGEGGLMKPWPLRTCRYITCTVQSMTVMDYYVFGNIWQLAIYIKSRLSLG